MNSLLKSIAALITTTFISYPTCADVTSSQPDIPTSQWESHTEGIALALTLITRTGKEGSKSFLTFYIKNTSNTVKEFAIYGSNYGFQFSSSDNNGAWHPSLNSAPFNGSGYMLSYAIKPGEIFSHEIEVSPDDLMLIKSHSIKCSLCLSRWLP